MATQTERIAILETRMASLETKMDQHMAETKIERATTNGKLDEILALRNKGVGAFWLASALAGIGAITLLSTAWEWIKHALTG